MTSLSWEGWEDQLIRTLYCDHHVTKQEVLSALQGRRTWKAVKHRAGKLGIPRADEWTPEEDALLQQLYPSPANVPEEIVKALGGDRSWSAVKHRARRIGLEREDPWTITENAVLREYFPDPLVTPEVIVALLDKKRSWSSIAKHARNALGISRLRSKTTAHHDYFRVIDMAEKAYFMGVIAADGCVYHKSPRYAISFRIQARDKIWLEKMVSPIKPDPKVIEYSVGQYRMARVDIYSKPLVLDLVGYGINHEKTTNFCWPEALPERFSMPFILGFFDGDGSLSVATERNGHKSWRWSLLGTRPFLQAVKSKLESAANVILRGPYRKTKDKHDFLYIIQSNSQEYVRRIDFVLNSCGLGLPRKHFPRGHTDAEA